MSGFEVFASPEKLSVGVAAHISQLASNAIQAQGRFSAALSGGSTPRSVYRLLAGQPSSNSLDWKRIHLFWGDERWVPDDHPDSNYQMVREALLDQIDIPEKNIHPVPVEHSLERAATIYENTLKAFFDGPTRRETNPSTFDLVLLGLGADGHTASLFPGSSALLEPDRLVVPVEHSQPPPPLVPRITLTLPAINASAQVTFIVAGRDKSKILKEVHSQHPGDAEYPAKFVQPHHGKLLWMVDKAAAAGL